jgi:hypothetical protein
MLKDLRYKAQAMLQVTVELRVSVQLATLDLVAEWSSMQELPSLWLAPHATQAVAI